MIFYHGSKHKNIHEFKIIARDKKDWAPDFGTGLYLTTCFDQAKEWSVRDSDSGAVYEFDLDLRKYKQIEYTSSDLQYVLYLCRIGLEDVAKEEIDGFSEADIISGKVLGVSAESFHDKAELFNSGNCSYLDLKSKTNLFGNQWCIKKEMVLDDLNGSLRAIYFTKKAGRSIMVKKQNL